MKKILLVSAMLLAATPAFALKVTNLDTVTHTVVLAGRGAAQRYVIAPGATENMIGATQGALSLETAPVKKKAKAALNSDGLLSGVIGAGRNQNIPADPMDNFVIWPGGDLRLQSHTKQAGRW